MTLIFNNGNMVDKISVTTHTEIPLSEELRATVDSLIYELKKLRNSKVIFSLISLARGKRQGYDPVVNKRSKRMLNLLEYIGNLKQELNYVDFIYKVFPISKDINVMVGAFKLLDIEITEDIKSTIEIVINIHSGFTSLKKELLKLGVLKKVGSRAGVFLRQES